jgi:hypothetical protein
MQGLSKKYTTAIKSLNYHEESPKIERISYLSKILKTRKYTLECLQNKKNNIIKRLQK